MQFVPGFRDCPAYTNSHERHGRESLTGAVVLMGPPIAELARRLKWNVQRSVRNDGRACTARRVPEAQRITREWHPSSLPTDLVRARCEKTTERGLRQHFRPTSGLGSEVPACASASLQHKRRPGSTWPPFIWLVSTDSRPVGTQPTAGPLNPHRAIRSCGPLPRRCAAAPR